MALLWWLGVGLFGVFVCRGGFVVFFKLVLGDVARAPTPSWGNKVGQAKPLTGETKAADRKDQICETTDRKRRARRPRRIRVPGKYRFFSLILAEMGAVHYCSNPRRTRNARWVKRGRARVSMFRNTLGNITRIE